MHSPVPVLFLAIICIFVILLALEQLESGIFNQVYSILPLHVIHGFISY